MRRLPPACLSLLLASTMFLAACASAPVATTIECPPRTADPRTPEDLWTEYIEGNGVFVGGDVHYTGLAAVREETKKQQRPPVSILSCADSRVMPEVTFERTIGELFVVRVAGNVAPVLDVASLEFAVANGWTTLLVVMGHADCGAIKAALATGEPGTPALRALVAQIRPALTGFPRTDNPYEDLLRRATEANVQYVAAQLTRSSELLAKCVAAKQLTIYKAYYDTASGRVVRLP